MDSQKLENILNLALDSDMEERDKSLELNVGYDEKGKTWELIVKYSGDLQRLKNPVIQVEELIAGYAIVTLLQSLIDSFAELDEVEYIEKPKRLFFALQQSKEASCILPVTVRGIKRVCIPGLRDCMFFLKSVLPWQSYNHDRY